MCSLGFMCKAAPSTKFKNEWACVHRMQDRDTTIRLRLSTKRQLDEFGKKNETYNRLLRRLVRSIRG